MNQAFLEKQHKEETPAPTPTPAPTVVSAPTPAPTPAHKETKVVNEQPAVYAKTDQPIISVANLAIVIEPNYTQ